MDGGLDSEPLLEEGEAIVMVERGTAAMTKSVKCEQRHTVTLEVLCVRSTVHPFESSVLVKEL